ncbi:MAG: glucose 1-dehydrogenase [Gemmatimonadales bacterium]
MQAVAVWPERRSVDVVEVAAPALGSPLEVRLRMLAVGVCGTDAEICSFSYGGAPPEGEESLIVGHEAIGLVIETGPEVSRLRTGDLAVPMVRRPCTVPHCSPCRSGHPDFCVTGEYTERGIKGAHGFLAGEVVEEERYLVAVPPPLREVGVLTEPLTIAEKALRQFVEVRRRLPWLSTASEAELLAGGSAVVLGAGAVGILGCMLLRQRGFQVVVYSRGRKPNPSAALVESLGAAYVSSEETPLVEVSRRAGAIDLVYEATGASKLAFDALQYLGANGVFVFTGVPGRKARVEIAADAIMRNLVLRNQTVLGTVNAGRADYEAAIRDLELFQAAWPGALAALITGRYPMSRFCDRARSHDKIKDVIEPADAK